ncbi:hypothetical protein, partial [Flavobacterium sp.]|uniref:hypothetical protein n=1 Tax=Flavobacterium sp. TaxID=239 RepID=UPI0025DD0F12
CNVDCRKFGVTEDKIDSIHTKLTATQYLNKKKTIIAFQYQTILEPIDYNGLDNFLEILQHHYLFCEYVNTSQKSIPNFIEMSSNKNKYLEIKLKKIQSVAVDFKVEKDKIVFKN